jgi:hypothetical protein
MVNTFFDSINKMSDSFTFSFIEELKQDIESILHTLYANATECITFFTFLLVLLRRLCPVDGAFTNTLLFTKTLIARINKDESSPKADFNKFFFKHLFRSYCSLIRECPNKRQQLCECIYAHCADDLNLRIKMVQSLKMHLKDDELVYACQSHLLAQETEYNEQWFDVFLYYALIGISNQKCNIRIYALNMLNTIAMHNPEGVLDVTSHINNLANESYWEIKAQCLEFATTMLGQFSSYSHLLAGKDDIKGGVGGANKGGAPKPGSGNGGGDRTAIKNSLQASIEIVKKVFNINAPKSVQKLGLFKLQPLLNEFKSLYQVYVEVLIQIEQEIK